MKLSIKYTLYIVIAFLSILGITLGGAAICNAAKSDFVVVIDPGHGGKDHGAIDNSAREKDINLAVALRLGELIDKKIKDTKVVFTRDNDTFISLQDRANIANKAKGNLFISIHTNSVDAKNKNRSTVAGASVYTLGNHKDEANMGVARRENSVIELENGYQQKYSGFDPNKDESYIIFEMAQKNNLSRSIRFAKMVQDNLVSIADRKDRGVHQAGFWVLWSTSMPSVLVELDFICNPESAKYMTSKEGVDQLAEAIFKAVKIYEQNWRQSERMALNQDDSKNVNSPASPAIPAKTYASNSNKKVSSSNKSAVAKGKNLKDDVAGSTAFNEEFSGTSANSTTDGLVALAYAPSADEKDLSHSQTRAASSQPKPRSASEGRRRRSAVSRENSELRNVEGEIKLQNEFTGATEKIESAPVVAKAPQTQDADSKGKKGKKVEKKPKVSTKKIEPSPAMKAKMAMEQQKKDAKKEEKNKDKKIMASSSKSENNSGGKQVKTNKDNITVNKSQEGGNRKSLKAKH